MRNAALRLTLCIALLPSSATAAALGEAVLRSYLGEPLHVRIEVSADDEPLEIECVSISAESTPFSVFRDARTALHESGAQRAISVRTHATVNEPIVKLVLRYGCGGKGSIARDYVLLLDPPSSGALADLAPIVTPPPAITSTPLPSRPSTATQSAPTSAWRVREGDTLAAIARGIFPRSNRLQRKWIAAVRSQNPALATLATDAPLTTDTNLALPDLRSLVKQSIATPNARVPAATATTKLPMPGSAKSDSTVAKPRTAPVAGRTPRTPAASGTTGTFGLRLSRGEIDPGRSEGVSEETRAALREKQAMLDADDQVAQFLALKNTVRHLEKRLNEIQSRLNASATNATVAATNAPAAAPASPAVILKTSAPPKASEAVQTPLPTWMIGAGALLVISVGIGLWWWRRPRAQHLSIEDLMAQSPPMIDAPPKPGTSNVIDQAEFEAAAHAKEFEIAQHAADELAMADTIRRRQPSAPPAAMLPTDPLDVASPEFDDGVVFDISVPEGTLDNATFDTTSFEKTIAYDAGACLDLDDSPSTDVDFPLDDEPPIDSRVQRLQYMQARFAELRNSTVLIDNAESIVNVARLYFDEGATDKACELLTFGVEERPQEMRFWLAQFEIYRRVNMRDAFVALAEKFELLFSQSLEWRRVRGIGQQIAPDHALFAGAPETASYDAQNDNWLAPSGAAAHVDFGAIKGQPLMPSNSA